MRCFRRLTARPHESDGYGMRLHCEAPTSAGPHPSRDELSAALTHMSRAELAEFAGLILLDGGESGIPLARVVLDLARR